MSALCQKRTLARLFDHLVGPRKQCLRQVNSNRLGGLEIYDQFEFCWFLDRKVTWPLTLKDLVHISRGATKQFDVARRIRHETPRVDILSVWIHARQPLHRREFNDLFSVSKQKAIGDHRHRMGARIGNRGKGVVELIFSAHLHHGIQRYSQCTAGFFYRFEIRYDAWVARIPEYGEPRERWDCLQKKLQPFPL